MNDLNDLELLSAYLDGELNPEERASLETRLADDPTLRRELNTLRATVELIGTLPTLRAPRNFTLPQSTRRSRTVPFPALFSAVSAAAALALLVAGILLVTQTPATDQPMAVNIAQAPTDTAERRLDVTFEADAPQAQILTTIVPQPAPSMTMLTPEVGAAMMDLMTDEDGGAGADAELFSAAPLEEAESAPSDDAQREMGEMAEPPVAGLVQATPSPFPTQAPPPTASPALTQTLAPSATVTRAPTMTLEPVPVTAAEEASEPVNAGVILLVLGLGFALAALMSYLWLRRGQ